jgi:hypothetical protein
MMMRGVVAALCLASAPAFAQTTDDPPAPPPGPPSTLDPALTGAQSAPTGSAEKKAEPAKKKKEPGRGDFDAGGQLRFPSGPDEMGEYKSFNWVAFDLKGRYYILDQITVDALFPLAVKKPDTVMISGASVEPSMIGGMQARLEAKMAAPKVTKYETEVGLQVTPGYMREGAMLLSEKDFPLFSGSFQPGIGLGVLTKVKLSSVVDFSLVPAYVYQSGSAESLTALHVPLALRVALGELLKVSLDAGVYTGDDLAFSGDEGGRISTGAAVTLKVGPIVLRTGAGVASLLTGGLYPTIGDSIYVDLNVKYAP